MYSYPSRVYDDYMTQYSMDLTDGARAARYFRDLLTVRRVALKHGLPFWNIVSANQIRPQTTIPSPANLQFQAYTTLAAGGRGVSWYTYNSHGYGYAPLDRHGNKTVTWQYLQMVNRQLKTLGPIMNRLTSTGVYFTSSTPFGSLPERPGQLVQAVDTDVPVMVGEFASEEGTRYVLPVNLSLERSAKLTLHLASPGKTGRIVSAEEGTELEMPEPNAFWLVAGQGVLIRLQ
ncbi:MAG: hypothetical protein COS65_16655 [Armatimonadetes bacterium CG06_land_8_20_14_3_00_66_21]|nr:MAG: hypothetical protein COS65_16655 [Armatimonadetes bacterium CG06_land_8_20_14_3_00_66_21]